MDKAIESARERHPRGHFFMKPAGPIPDEEK